jgi:hypothetical protein
MVISDGKTVRTSVSWPELALCVRLRSLHGESRRIASTSEPGPLPRTPNLPFQPVQGRIYRNYAPGRHAGSVRLYRFRRNARRKVAVSRGSCGYAASGCRSSIATDTGEFPRESNAESCHSAIMESCPSAAKRVKQKILAAGNLGSRQKSEPPCPVIHPIGLTGPGRDAPRGPIRRACHLD